MKVPFLMNSDGGCGESFCSWCEPDWIKCQYCDIKLCEFCRDEDGVYVCQGEGCTRVNCMYGECMDNNSKKAECVKMCADYDEGCWDTYCTDCRVKACQKKDWKKCCPVCVRKVAPVLAVEVKKLRKENKKLRERV